MAGLFDTFTVAKRGLAVQQSNINTSSHNIANAQTEGYSRQRSVTHTTRPFGGMSRFDSCIAGQVGTGAEVTGIMRIRDTFLDYQVRTENTNYGYSDIKNQYLSEVEDILNDTSDTGVQTSLSKFFSAYQEVSNDSTKQSNRTVAIKQASALADILNTKYRQLENKKSDAQKELKEYTTTVNGMLDQINELNKQISSVCAVGMTPNDLMDSRDLLIDKLSSKFGVKVDRNLRETMDLKVTEDTTIPNLVNSDPNDANYTRFSYVESAEYGTKTVGGVTVEDTTKLIVKYSVLGNKDNQKTIEVTGSNLSDLKKTLMEDRMLIADKDGNVLNSSSTTTGPTATTDPDSENIVKSLDADGVGTVTKTVIVGGQKTETVTTYSKITAATDLNKKIFNSDNITKGEIAGNQKVQDDIQTYMDQLDKFAAALAYTVNAIQTGDRQVTADPDTGIVKSDGTKVTAELVFEAKKADGSSTDSDAGITAKNITINADLEKDPGKLNCGQYSVDDYSGVKDGTRALAIADLNKLKIDIGNLSIADGDISTREAFFTKTGLDFDSKNLNLTTNKEGTKLSDYYSSTLSSLYINNEAAAKEVDNEKVILQALENQKTSISGVSLDEEMTDLIQFQHAYQANAKMINTIDQLLDVVINGLKA